MKKPFKQFVYKYLLPRSLGNQLAMLSILVVSIILVTQTIENSDEHAEEQIKSALIQAEILAQNIASTSAGYLYAKNYAAIEGLLMESATYPDVTGIQVTNHLGMIVSDVRQEPEQLPQPYYDKTALTPPNLNKTTSVKVSDIDAQVWHPVANDLGWVRVTYSLKTIHEQKFNHIWHNMFELSFMIAATSILLFLFLKAPAKALRDLARFSEGLGTNEGKQLDIDYPSIEIEQLTESLNKASEKLHKSSSLVHDELDKLSAYKYATDMHSIVSITRKNGRIIYVNDNFCNISKYNRNELIERNHNVLSSAYHPKSFFKDMWDTISRGNVWHGEMCNRNKHGKLYWVNTTIVPIVDENNVPYQYIDVSNDITNEKQQRKTLEHISEFPQNNPHITLSMDADGEIMYTNMAAVRMMVKLALANKIIQRMFPEDMKAFINGSLEADCTLKDIESTVMDTNLLWAIHPLTKKNIVQCYAVDITESKASEQRLREAYSQLQEAVENGSAGSSGKSTTTKQGNS